MQSRVLDSHTDNNENVGIPEVSLDLFKVPSIHSLIEELSNIDSEDDDLITLTQLSVSDYDYGED